MSLLSQMDIVAPMTSCPSCFKSSAATDESTPPLIPTRIFIFQSFRQRSEFAGRNMIVPVVFDFLQRDAFGFRHKEVNEEQ